MFSGLQGYLVESWWGVIRSGGIVFDGGENTTRTGMEEIQG